MTYRKHHMILSFEKLQPLYYIGLYGHGKVARPEKNC